ncbi:MAG: transketolase C-terminal domain-containing protein [Spirochaetaceae bacterium]
MDARNETVEDARRGLFYKLLELKDSDIRILTIEQGFSAADRGIHSGGAMSSVVPLVSLYYGGMMNYDVAHPTELQDMFVLSKGHAIASMASVYADIGYFDRSLLDNSRSYESILNGHPGPLLPGVHLPTGPMGQGICAAGGLALAGRREPLYDVFTLTGDGELQEGSVWEAVMYSAAKRVDNFCVLIDKNGGQLDNPKQNSFPMDNIEGELEAFGFSVLPVDGRSYRQVVAALESFKYGERDGRPTAIVLYTEKGYGAYSEFMVKHKVTLSPDVVESELAQQEERRRRREEALFAKLESLMERQPGAEFEAYLQEAASSMHYRIDFDKALVQPIQRGSVVEKAEQRDKRIRYTEEELPRIERGESRQASAVIKEAMRVFARDPRVFSVDADLSSTSGLEAGVSYRDRTRAFNVGIAEANMMCIGEAFAVTGANSWVSTFCPFFNWNVLRRIAIGEQERKEVIAEKDGWLNTGYGLDLTFLATAANFDTKTNGATHMGNDDILFFEHIGGLKIIDTSCPRQVLEVMRWIMEGNRGLVYMRIMRAPSAVLYGDDYRFSYGKGYYAARHDSPDAVIISSGREVHEALEASKLCAEKGRKVDVVDMPSIDAELLLELYRSKLPLIIPEQNNGWIWNAFRRSVFEGGGSYDSAVHLPINLLTPEGSPQYIHSGTYEELVHHYGLSAEKLAERLQQF